MWKTGKAALAKSLHCGLSICIGLAIGEAVMLTPLVATQKTMENVWSEPLGEMRAELARQRELGLTGDSSVGVEPVSAILSKWTTGKWPSGSVKREGLLPGEVLSIGLVSSYIAKEKCFIRGSEETERIGIWPEKEWQTIRFVALHEDSHCEAEERLKEIPAPQRMTKLAGRLLRELMRRGRESGSDLRTHYAAMLFEESFSDVRALMLLKREASDEDFSLAVLRVMQWRMIGKSGALIGAGGIHATDASLRLAAFLKGEDRRGTREEVNNIAAQVASDGAAWVIARTALSTGFFDGTPAADTWLEGTGWTKDEWRTAWDELRRDFVSNEPSSSTGPFVYGTSTAPGRESEGLSKDSWRWDGMNGLMCVKDGDIVHVKEDKSFNELAFAMALTRTAEETEAVYASRGLRLDLDASKDAPWAIVGETFKYLVEAKAQKRREQEKLSKKIELH